MYSRSGHVFLVAFVLIAATTACSRQAATMPGVQWDTIDLPGGFSISLYAGDIPDARPMALSDDGALLVPDGRAGVIYRITHEE